MKMVFALRNAALITILAAAFFTPCANAYQINATGSTPLIFGAGATSSTVTEKMRITPAGLIGIGTATPTTAITISGTISATTFVGDGSGLTNLAGSGGDNITSSTTKVTVNSTGYTSFTTGGVTTGYMDTAGRLYSPGVGVGVAPTSTYPIYVSNSGTTFGLLLDGSNNYSGVGFYRAGTQQGTIIQEATGNMYYTARTDNVFRAGGATERMRLTAAGLVGIGIAAPSATLDVAGATSGNSLLLRSGDISSGINSGTQIRFGYSNSANYMHSIRTRHNSGAVTGNAIDFWVWNYLTDSPSALGSQLVMSVGSPGVGINTTNVTNALEVSGTVSATRFVGDGSSLTNIAGASSDRITSGTVYVVAQSGGSILTSGSFYINNGVSATDAALRIGTNATGNHYAYIDMAGDTTYTGYGLRIIRYNTGPNAPSQIFHRGTGDLTLYAQDQASISLLTSSTERMRINASGVGIGTAPVAGNNIVLGPQDTSNEGAQISWQASNGSYTPWTTDVYANAFRIYNASVTPSTINMFSTASSVSLGVNLQAAPNVALDVNGAIVSRVYNNSAATSFDWSKSNAQYTTATCGAMTMTNMQDGGTYSLLISSTTAGTCSFSQSGLTFKLPAGHGATTSGKTTLYGFTRFGTNVYVTWQPGY